MFRPAAGAAARGLALPSVSRKLSTLSAISTHPQDGPRRLLATAVRSYCRPHAAPAAASAGASRNDSGDVGCIRYAAAVAGSALALWLVSPGQGSPASCTSQAMEARPLIEQEELGAKVKVEVTPSSPETSKTERSNDAPAAQSKYTAGEAASVALVVASTYNGNGPIEDRHDIRQSPRGDFFASVYDGHGGWQAAELARRRLNIAAQTELKNSLAENPDQVMSALTQAFLRVEREYLYQVKAAFELGFGAVARTGACAIMALLRDDNLFVANAGDCRAVLGRRRRRGWVGGGVGSGEGASEAVALSNDHNAREESEQAKLRKLHPFEGDVFTCKRASSCYVKGRLQPTRSLGDAYLKYPEFNGQEDAHRSAGRFLPPPYTPPYITAEPEISVHKIDRAMDDFVVLASDGLWDHVSNDEAVDIVRIAAYEDGDPESAGDRLIKCVLERAAEKHGLSVKELQEVPEGSRRRNMHDDITCVVFFLKGNRNNDGFGSLEGYRMPGQADPRVGVPPAQ